MTKEEYRMRSWAFTAAVAEAICPHCGAQKGSSCRTPKGEKYNRPHVERSLFYRFLIGNKEWSKRHEGGIRK